MATGTTSNYTAGTGYDTIFRPNFIDGIFKNNHLLGLMINGRAVFPSLPVGDSSYRWKMAKGYNSNVEVFSEQDTAPTPVAVTYANLALDYIYFWGWIRISGHMRDVAKNASYPGLNPVANEFISTRDDIRDLVNTTFMGASNNGLLAAVSSTTTYAGQARGSAAWFEASDTNQNGALTRQGLMNLHETVRDNDKGGSIDVWLVSHNQATNYIYLTGEPNAQNSSIRVEMTTAGGGSLDLSPHPNNLFLMGAPIVPLPDWDDNDWVGLDLRQTPVGPNVGISVRREFEMRGPDMSGDDDVWEISTALTPVVHSPMLTGKLYDCTT